MIIALMAIAPVIALLLYFYHKDKYEREPLRFLALSFFYGFMITFVAMVVEVALLSFVAAINEFVVRIFLQAFVVAALVEEGLKFMVFRALVYRSNEFNEPYDGIVYAVMISLGFATLENILYLLSSYGRFGLFGVLNVGVFRALISVPLHAFCGVIMGYYLGLAKFTDSKEHERRYIYAGLGLAIFAHGFFNFFAFSGLIFGVCAMLLVFVLCWIFSVKAIKIHMVNSPFKK
ncbi:MAG: PrsW family glutamic-type intramembrane protease [Candidatus Omnitrophota bacterium]